jgi:hypothetical protein
LIEIATPDTELVEVDLVTEPTLFGGGDGGKLSRRLQIGRPIVRPLTADQCAGAVPTLQGYAERRQDLRFVALQLDVSFRPDDDEPHVRAGVGVSLKTQEQGLEAVARALSPVRSSAPVQRTTTIGLALNLQFVEPTVERSTSAEHEETFLVASGEGTPDPEWQFTRTRRFQLEGIHSLRLVIEAPCSTGVDARVALSSTVRRRRYGLVPYRAALPPELENIPLIADE